MAVRFGALRWGCCALVSWCKEDTKEKEKEDSQDKKEGINEGSAFLHLYFTNHQ